MCMIGKWRHTMRVPRCRARVAYRAFTFYGGKLRPVYQSQPAFARCGNKSTEPVAKHSDHGFWSYKTYAAAFENHYSRLIAKVLIHGQVAVHTRGYRSSRLELVAVMRSYYNSRQDEVAVAYSISVEAPPRG